MGRARSVPLRIQGRPGAVIVAAPREVAGDELRLARLEDYLQARFPEVDVTVVDRMTGPGGRGFVGTTAEADTIPATIVTEIAEAVRRFTDYGESRRGGRLMRRRMRDRPAPGAPPPARAPGR